MVSLSSYKIRGRKHWEDVVPLRALRLPTHITTTGKRPYHGALRFSSIHIEIRKKKILLTTTSRSVPVANSTKCTDRKVHTARILFQPPFLSVFLDGASAPVLESVVDLSIVVDEHGGASVGFTASTGGGHENHDILNWSFTGTDASSSVSVVSSDITFMTSTCLPDRNLCTPENAVVEHSGAGYHVILPGNLEWGASIPNRPSGTVVVTNAHGIVCWDLRARGSDGCSGPSGNRTPVGAEFIAADAPAGALLMRTHEGHVWFSVNGRRGIEFKNNQGFYEFDLEIK
jgi:hypothetical protein